MNKFDIKRLGLILAVQAEIEGMKSANACSAANGREPTYDEKDFVYMAEQLRNVVNKKDKEL